MILLFGIFGLGITELVIVILALLLLLSPKDFALIKPIVKSIYKGWLEYRGEVETAQKDMEELKHSVMMPLEEAEREVETELVKSKTGIAGMRKSIGGAGTEMRREIGKPIQEVRGGIGAARKEVGAAGKETGLAGMRRGFAGAQARQSGLPAQEAKGAATVDKGAETRPPESAAGESKGTEPMKKSEAGASASEAKPVSQGPSVKSGAKLPAAKSKADKKKGEEK